MLPETSRQRFAYNADAPLNLRVLHSEQRGAVMLQDVQYDSPLDGQPIRAWLLQPAGEGPFAGLLYAHWYEPEAPDSNRDQFLEEALALAAEGVVALLPETMWSEPGWYQQGRNLDSDYGDALRQVQHFRRALDVLLAQPGVDAARLAYVGHDFGAMYGTLMGAADGRPAAYVLIAGASDFNEWMLFGVPADRPGLDAYKAQMASLAPWQYVAAIQVPILFQFGTDDPYTPQADYEAYVAAAKSPKTLHTYASGHAMALPQIRQDRLRFLREQLLLQTSE